MIAARQRASFQVGRVLLLLLAAASTPLWLPSALGGGVQYHNVLTGSMTGTADRGSLVVVFPQEAYAPGDVVAFVPPHMDDYNITMLHRIIGVNEQGHYLIKGDVTPGVDVVPHDRVLGKMLFSIPYVGFLAGAARAFPLLALVALVAFLCAGRPAPATDHPCIPGSAGAAYFLIAAGVLALTLPFASVGLAHNGNKWFACALVTGLLITVRLMEVAFQDELDGYVELLYVAVVAAGVSMVSVPSLVDGFKVMFLS